MYVDVGAEGKCSDSGIFKQSDLLQGFKQDLANLPAPARLFNDTETIPYFLVGDHAFGQRTWLMKPYPYLNAAIQNRIFN